MGYEIMMLNAWNNVQKPYGVFGPRRKRENPLTLHSNSNHLHIHVISIYEKTQASNSSHFYLW